MSTSTPPVPIFFVLCMTKPDWIGGFTCCCSLVQWLYWLSISPLPPSLYLSLSLWRPWMHLGIDVSCAGWEGPPALSCCGPFQLVQQLSFWLWKAPASRCSFQHKHFHQNSTGFRSVLSSLGDCSGFTLWSIWIENKIVKKVFSWLIPFSFPKWLSTVECR